MGITSSYSTALSKEDGVKLILAPVERGVIFFNTAEVYGRFTNEEAVCEARATSGGFFGLLTGKRLV